MAGAEPPPVGMEVEGDASVRRFPAGWWPRQWWGHKERGRNLIEQSGLGGAPEAMQKPKGGRTHNPPGQTFPQTPNPAATLTSATIIGIVGPQHGSNGIVNVVL
jgi:hypothetical protein